MLVANTVLADHKKRKQIGPRYFIWAEWYLFENILDPGQHYENQPNWDDWNMITHSISTDLYNIGLCLFNTTFVNISVIAMVSFMDRGNRSIHSKSRKPLTCPKSLTNFITQGCIEYISNNLSNNSATTPPHFVTKETKALVRKGDTE